MYGAEHCTLQKADHKQPENIELWWWRWTERLILFNWEGNEDVLHIAKEKRSSVHAIERRNCNLVGHVFLENCLTKHDIACKIYGSL